MLEQQSSYRQIMKATSLFGGVQVFNIIISIIRSKFIAVLLGPAGMGIVGLLNSTTGLIAGITNFGLSTSAIRDISASEATGNQTRISVVVTVLKRWVWITGLLGTVLTLVLSPWLSQLTFGNKDYTIAFIWISITLLLGQLSSGQMVLLQGMRKIQFLAKANVTGSVLGLVTTIPLYYFWGIKGIVPAIIIASASSLMLSWYFSQKLKIEPIKVSRVRTIAEGKNMLTMGFMISLSGLITMATSYLVRIYISNAGGLADVGLYNAGFAIVSTYVGLVFTAMGTDYYPRLSATANDNIKSRMIINQQSEIAIFILAPIITAFLVFINWVVILLYSSKFLAINDMILYAILGIFFKAASWSIAFIFLAKGASKLFFWNELIANIYMLALNILGYKFWGLTGLGISFIVGYVLYVIQVYIIAKIKYEFSFSNAFYKIFSFQFINVVVCLIVVKLLGSPYSYVIGSLIILVSAFYSYRELDKRLDIKSIILSIKNRK